MASTDDVSDYQHELRARDVGAGTSAENQVLSNRQIAQRARRAREIRERNAKMIASEHASDHQDHSEMKRAAPWEQSYAISSDDSSSSDSEDDKLQSSKNITSEAAGRKRLSSVDYEALSKHGYSGGPSVLKVPPPRIEEKEQDWSWSIGKRNGADDDATEESYEAREQTRASLLQGEKLLGVQMNMRESRKENISFSQKEKRKRDLGQASRGKSYVEEEKRLLRDNGVYSGFDS